MHRRLFDHLYRWCASTAGFRYLGVSWSVPWVLYFWNPLLGKLLRGRSFSYRGFNIRFGECDLYTLANLFVDYDCAFLKRELARVERVIDAGANVGAFSWLVRQLNPRIPILALEPDSDCYRSLTAQPCARDIDCRRVALGAARGVGCVRKGENSVTSSVATAGEGGESVEIVPLEELLTPQRVTFFKLDVEGSEKDILATPVPESVSSMMFEWHYDSPLPETVTRSGILQHVGVDAPQASCWVWKRINGDRLAA